MSMSDGIRDESGLTFNYNRGNEEFDNDKSQFIKQLHEFKGSWDEPSWSPNKIELFKHAVENSFLSFPYKHKIKWDRDFGINGEHVLNLTISTIDWGQISTQLNIEMIKTVKYGKDFPQQLKQAFERRFKDKITKIKIRIKELENPTPIQPVKIIPPPEPEKIKSLFENKNIFNDKTIKRPRKQKSIT
jgi:hypothetical protein